MADPDKAQAVFEEGAEDIKKAIVELSSLGAGLDRRSAKMRDMKDKLRSLILGAGSISATGVSGKTAAKVTIKGTTSKVPEGGRKAPSRGGTPKKSGK
jgi:hypothetical protein